MESLAGNNKYIKFNPEPVKIRKKRVKYDRTWAKE